MRNPGDAKQTEPDGQSVDWAQVSPILALEFPAGMHCSSQVLQTLPPVQSRSPRQPTTQTPSLPEKSVWPLQTSPAAQLPASAASQAITQLEGPSGRVVQTESPPQPSSPHWS
jgi:hypothetical protein